MKISLEWLSEYLPGPFDATAAAEALTHGGLPVESIEKVGLDTVIDVEVTSNRGDCLSHIGIARELSALLGRPFKDVQPAAGESATPASSVTQVRIDAPDLCPHYTARILRGIRVKPSPTWMVRRLEAAGVRAINNIVDVTNYVMFEMGQPLHAFDFDKLDGRRIIVRTARGREKIVSIDARERELHPPMLVIADAVQPVALAGVMGGRDSEVSDATLNILLEAARFDSLSVRRTARAQAMMSESSYRFERQIDPLLPERASLRAAQLMLQIAGGELLAGIVSAGATGHSPKRLSLRLAKLTSVLGTELPLAQVLGALTRLDLAPIHKGDAIDCTVPSYRLDLNLEIDLVEEVARVVGYGNIPQRDEISLRLAPPDPNLKTIDTLRSMLVSSGYYEAITFSFVSDLLAGDFLPPQAHSLPHTDNVRWRADNNLRPSILPGLLEAVRRNETAGTMSAKLFEIGSTFWYDAGGKLIETRQLGLAGSGELREVRGVVETLLARLNADRPIRIVPDQRKGYSPTACGRIEWGGQAIGYLGLIDAAVCEKLSLRQTPVGAELEVAPLLASAQHVPQLHPLPVYPPARRDVSLVVAETVRYEQIDALVRSLNLPQLEDSEYVTTYRGKPLEKGTKSVTIALVFRSPTGTLTGEEVEGAVQRLTEAAKERLGAGLRV